MSVIELDQTNEQYHADVSILSNSAKELSIRNPRLFKAIYIDRTQQPAPATPARRLGGAAHKLILEYEDFGKCYLVQPEANRATTAGKELIKAFDLGYGITREKVNGVEVVTAPGGMTVISTKEHSEALKIRDAVMGSTLARRLIESEGETEHSFAWEDADTGIMLKSRPDKTLLANVILDIKTCRLASPANFTSDCHKHGYPRTAAWRIRGHFARSGVLPVHLFIAVSKETGDVGVYELGEQELALGQRQNDAALRKIMDYTESGNWLPEWSRSPMVLRFSPWQMTEAFELEDDDNE